MFVVPEFKAIFEKFKAELPLSKPNSTIFGRSYFTNMGYMVLGIYWV